MLVPEANDQFLVAEAAVAAGMAVRVLPGELDGERLGRVLDRALTDRSLAASAAELHRGGCLLRRAGGSGRLGVQEQHWPKPEQLSKKAAAEASPPAASPTPRG